MYARVRYGSLRKVVKTNRVFYNASTVVGIVRITWHLSSCHSLKEKRSLLLRIKQRLKHVFEVSLVEVGDLDVWQSAQLGFAVVAQPQRWVHSEEFFARQF